MRTNIFVQKIPQSPLAESHSHSHQYLIFITAQKRGHAIAGHSFRFSATTFI